MTQAEALGLILLVLVQLDPAELEEIATHARVLLGHHPDPNPNPTEDPAC